MSRMPTLGRNDFLVAGQGGLNVVMTHGTLMDRTMFNPQIAFLEGDHRVLAYNFRAATSLFATNYDLLTLADDCAAITTDFEMDSFVLVGMSMGGYMALEFALRYPERLRGLVLIDAMAGAYSPEKRETYAQTFTPLNATGALPRAFAEWCVPICFGRRTIDQQPALVEHWLDRWTARPARSVFGEYLSWIDKRDVTPYLSEIRVPTLVVHGTDDEGLPFESSALPLVEGIPGAVLAQVEGAGHTSNLESPDQVNDYLQAFLREIP